VVGGIGVVYDDRSGVIPACDGPDEGGDQTDESPAEEEVNNEDARRAIASANQGDDGGHEIRNEEQGGDAPAEGKWEYPKE